MEEKKNLLTYAGLKKLEDELHDFKVVTRKEVAGKIKDCLLYTSKAGKKNHIIVNAEGIGHSEAMARRIEAATGIETRATILGHMQRGGNPTCKDRVYASMMGALAVDLLVQGKSCRVVGYRHGEFMDFDINEALAMQKDVSPYMWEVCNSLSHNYKK